MPIRELDILAPAKVNLFLSVLGKRPDGYHDLISVMQKIDLVDQLHLCLEGSGISLSCPSSVIPEDSRNLVWQAARLFFDRTGINDNVSITLRKMIPVAAGLGGGSSDAAATLSGLNTLCAAGLSTEELLCMAARLGADVPFFVADMPTALVTGIGTELQSITGPRGYWLVLVNPGLAVSTRWVYENLLLTSEANPYKLRGYSDLSEYAASLLGDDFAVGDGDHALYNDLESVTVKKHPVIQTIKEQLLADGAFAALMSGSGSTVFGLFRHLDVAEKSRASFRKLYQDVFLVTPLT
ncbi:MAG: 4-(cytidine 5'-diphospho)-2-C-methyl-D-erythritol kinase [Desulfobulbaceae bacterium]|nr:4-(cytidine 5'-diphospho)-2-C-methyl-D-erythritol kinase [Desulfobulbaceae bacterium]